jgi:hypothetical protein
MKIYQEYNREIKIYNHSEDVKMYRYFDLKKIINSGDVEKLLSLIEDPLLNLSICDDIALRIASQNQSIDIIKILLKDKRVNPSIGINMPIKKAISFNNEEMLKLLLNHNKNIINKSNIELFEFALQKKSFSCLKILIEDGRIDPSKDYNFLIQDLFDEEQHELVELLWKDNRIKDTLKEDNEYLYDMFIKKSIEKKINLF